MKDAAGRYLAGGRYRIDRVLGRGEGRTVYEVFDFDRGASLVLKAFPPASEPDEANPAAARLAFAEFARLAGIDFPGIISVLDCGLEPADGSFYFTTRLVEGREFLEGLAGRSFETFIDVMARILRALDFLHRRGIVHGDLKPQNVLIEERDGRLRPQIIDFGLARSLRDRDTDGASGTLLYMAPEVLEGRSPGRASDLYSLGLMVSQHLHGRLPFDDSNPEASIRDRLEDRIALPADPPDGVPERFLGILGKLLKRDPGQRYMTAHEALNDLSACAPAALPLVTRDTLAGRVRSSEPDLLDETTGRIMAAAGIAGGEGTGAVVFCSPGCAGLLGERAVFAASAAGVRSTLVRQPEGAHSEELALAAILTALRGERPAASDDGIPAEPLGWTPGALKRAASAGRGSLLILLLSGPPAGGSLMEKTLEELGALCGAGTIRLAVFVAGEPTETGPLWPSESEHGTKRIRGGLLDRDRCSGFVAGLFDWREVPPALISLLCPAETIDFHELREMLVYLAAAGIIDFEMGEFRFVESRLAGASVSGLENLMDCSLDSLGRGEREMAGLLSIFPDGAPVELLLALSRDPDVRNHLDSLQDRGLVAINDGGLGFAAALKSYALRRMVHDRLPATERKEIHAAAARWLQSAVREADFGDEVAVREADFGDEVAVREAGTRDEVAVPEARTRDEIAFHWARSGDAERAAPALLKAIEDHLTANRFGRADSLADEALRMDGFLELPEAFRIIHHKGRVAAYLGRVDEAVALFDRADAIASGPGSLADPCDRAAILTEKAKAFVRTGETAKADACYDEILELDLAGTPAGRILRAQALSFRAYSLYRQHRSDEALRELETAVALMDTGDSDVLATVLNRLGTVLFSLGRFADAEERYRQSIRMFDAIDREVEARGPLYNLGRILKTRGRKTEALERMGRALELSRIKDDTYSICTTLTGLSSTYLDMGDLQEARQYALAALEVARELGSHRNRAFVYGNLGEIALFEGDPDRAADFFSRSEEIWKELGDDRSVAKVGLQRTERAIRLKRFDEAEDLIRRSREQAGGEPEGIDALIEARVQGGLSLAAGRLDGAVAAVDRCLAAVPELAETEAAHILRLLRARILAALRMGEEALEETEILIVALPEGGNPALGAMARIVRCKALRILGRPNETAVREAISRLARGRHRETLAEGYLELARSIIAGSGGRDSFKNMEDALQVLKEAARLARSVGNGPLLDEIEAEDQAIRRAAPGEGGEPEIIRRLANMERLQEITRIINSEMDLKRLLDLIVDTALEITGALRGFIILVKSGKFHFVAARHISEADINDPEFEVSHSISRKVATIGEPVLTTNAQDDERFRDAGSISELKLLSVLCVPLRKKDSLLGSLYIDNPNTIAAFDEYDLKMMEAFAAQAGIALGNAELLDLNIERQKELTRSKAEIERLNLELKRKVDDQAQELVWIKGSLENKQRELELKYRYDNIVTHSARMIEVLRILDRITATDFPVMILGESGTGKELIARSIHYNGPRRKADFVSVNCAAVAEPLIESELFGYKKGAFTGADRDKEGLFEAADRGTLFLDEIGDMSLEVQKRLLRVLQFGEFMRVGGKEVVKVDVRVISATNKDIHAMVEAGTFREDLYYRLNVAVVKIPPLRDRREDIPLLIDHFRKHYSSKGGRKKIEFEPAAFEELVRYSWKGNVRELENVIKNMTYLDIPDGRVTLKEVRSLIEDTAAAEEKKHTLKETVELFERARIIDALQMHNGNKTKAAKELGVSLRGLYKKLTKYGIQ